MSDDLSRPPSRGYTIRADIILSASVIAFFLVFLGCCWGCINPGDTPTRRRRYYNNLMGVGGGHTRRRTNRVLNMDPTNTTPAHVTFTRGLDASVLKSLPVFTYSSKTNPDSSLECAVCLSEFEENESGRVLPKCNHIFHLNCIDMWFHSHSTCPTCRSPVEPILTQPEIPTEVVLTITEPDSSSGLCQNDEEQVVTSSFGGQTKPMELDVPKRQIEEFEDESRCDSQSDKSPMSRMLSFTRILSIDKRDNSSSPSVNPASCGRSVSETDIERGKDETKKSQG